MSTPGTNFSAGQDAGAGSQTCDRDWLLTAGAGTLLLLALSKRSTLGLAALAGGAYLLYRSLPSGTVARLLPEQLRSLGRCPPSGGASCRVGQDWYPSENADIVDESSMDSFPASDPATKF